MGKTMIKKCPRCEFMWSLKSKMFYGAKSKDDQKDCPICYKGKKK